MAQGKSYLRIIHFFLTLDLLWARAQPLARAIHFVGSRHEQGGIYCVSQESIFEMKRNNIYIWMMSQKETFIQAGIHLLHFVWHMWVSVRTRVQVMLVMLWTMGMTGRHLTTAARNGVRFRTNGPSQQTQFSGGHRCFLVVNWGWSWC